MADVSLPLKGILLLLWTSLSLACLAGGSLEEVPEAFGQDLGDVRKTPLLAIQTACRAAARHTCETPIEGMWGGKNHPGDTMCAH